MRLKAWNLLGWLAFGRLAWGALLDFSFASVAMGYTHTISCSIEFTFESDNENWREALDEHFDHETPFKDLTAAERWEWFEEQAPGSLEDYLSLVETKRNK